MLNLILELFLHNTKLCTNYKHWIHNCNKNMKQFYICINQTCALNLWGEETQPLIKCKQNKVYIIHTFAMESPSFSSPLVDHERQKKNMNLLIHMCM